MEKREYNEWGELTQVSVDGKATRCRYRPDGLRYLRESADGKQREHLWDGQEMVEEAFRLALKELRELPREDYVSLLAGLAARASSTGREELIFSQTDRATVGKAVAQAANRMLRGGKLTLSQECRSMEGGFVLRGDGVEVNCGLAAMLRWERERLTVDVAGVLFP